MTRGDVHLVRLDPTLGSEIKKTRPCVVVSPDELNAHLRTAVVAPMTTGGKAYPWRIRCRFQGRSGFVALDQLRTVDQERLAKRLGTLQPDTMADVSGSLTQGKQLAVSGQTVDSSGITWYQVQGGWVRSDVVTVSGDCSAVPTVTP